MPFSALIATLRSNGHIHSVTIGPEWSQGRATFGGLLAALANAALRREINADTPLRGLQVTFVGPAHPGALQLHTRLLRRGKSVTLARCDLLQDDNIVATVTGSYGLARTPPVQQLPTPAAAPRAQAETSGATGFVDGGAASFHQFFTLRRGESSEPDAAVDTVYLRHCEVVPCTEAHLIAIADVLPSPAVNRVSRPTVGSSLMWTLEIIDHDFSFAADAWWRVDTEIHAAVDGYVHESRRIINPHGRVAALATQIFTLFFQDR